MTPIAQRKCAPSGVAVPGRNTGFVSPFIIGENIIARDSRVGMRE
jgi:hypothetical protein